MKPCLFVVMVCSFFAACSSDDVPKDVIPLEKMKLIVFDVMRSEQLASIKYSKDTAALRRTAPEFYQQVFSIYKISKDDFYKSFDYYEAHPDKEKELLDSVSAIAGRNRQEIYLKHR